MAPPRPPRVDRIVLDDGELLGLLVCRATGAEARALARAFLTVDELRAPEEADALLDGAGVREGRWFKTPDHSAQGFAWQIHEDTTGRKAGSTPGVFYDFG